MKKPLLLCTVLMLSAGFSGCGPSAKEIELEQMLKAAQAKTQAAQAGLDAANKKIAELETQAKGDLQYLVLKKEYIEGKLEATGDLDTVTNKKGMQRTSPRWLVYFQGVQTKREYPAIEVAESGYKQFMEGAVYTREEINRAKK